ncbi:hypothetical protein QQF64_029488 [Cirrhinus molitorella]|uniref:Peptidase A2 domain-containing protein n=1 Tax=Cirrhinus molitorella TaxID=172907 RepID=A0ABR3N0R2_9TELE
MASIFGSMGPFDESRGSKAYKVTVLLEGQPVKMEIDTGAAVSLVSDAVYSEILSNLPLKPPDVTLKTYTGESVAMKGLIQYSARNYQSVTSLFVVQSRAQDKL